MNLHNIVSDVIPAVNPMIDATIEQSQGYTTDTDGSRVPIYAAPIPIQIQMQALVYNDLVQLDGLNIQGEKHGMYLNGNWQGVVRADQSGGDRIVLSTGTVWLVVLVLENWADVDGWAKVAVTRQMS